LFLLAQKNVLAWLEVDLDEALYFGRGLLALTSERLLWQPADAPKTWQSLPLQPDMQLELVDHAGVGKLSARNATQLLAEWRFTLGHNLQAASLLSRFNKLQAGHSPASWQVWCPTCHAPLTDPDQACKACNKGGTQASLSAWRKALPAATAKLRNQRTWPMRRIALPSVKCKKSCAVHANSETKEAAPKPWRSSKSGTTERLANLFQGQTNWQSSQP
jgi:hypothetical protein